MLRDGVIRRDRSIVIEIEVVCQRDAMPRYDRRDFMFYIAEERDVTNCRLALSCELLARIEFPLATEVTKKKGSALMGCWKDDHE